MQKGESSESKKSYFYDARCSFKSFCHRHGLHMWDSATQFKDCRYTTDYSLRYELLNHQDKSKNTLINYSI